MIRYALRCELAANLGERLRADERLEPSAVVKLLEIAERAVGGLRNELDGERFRPLQRVVQPGGDGRHARVADVNGAEDEAVGDACSRNAKEPAVAERLLDFGGGGRKREQ